jgi:hypothetical protein
VQVHHDERVAICIDPESCAVTREGRGEALTGDDTGQPLSLVMNIVPGADALSNVEGNTDGSAIASTRTARRGRRTWHVSTLLAREPGGLTIGQQRRVTCAALVRIGKARSQSR